MRKTVAGSRKHKQQLPHNEQVINKRNRRGGEGNGTHRMETETTREDCNRSKCGFVVSCAIYGSSQAVVYVAHTTRATHTTHTTTTSTTTNTTNNDTYNNNANTNNNNRLSSHLSNHCRHCNQTPYQIRREHLTRTTVATTPAPAPHTDD